jgi:hypothetical protein
VVSTAATAVAASAVAAFTAVGADTAGSGHGPATLASQKNIMKRCAPTLLDFHNHE